MMALLCLVAVVALAPYAAEALNCKSCIYAEVANSAVDTSTLNTVLATLGMDSKCKSGTSSPTTTCPSNNECLLLKYSADINLPGVGSITLETTYRGCYQGDESNRCDDVTDTNLPGKAGTLMSSLQRAGIDVTDVDGRICYCDSNNCNLDEGSNDKSGSNESGSKSKKSGSKSKKSGSGSREDDGDGATAVSVTLMTLVTVVAAGLAITEL